MRVVVLRNSIAGRGKGRTAVQLLLRQLDIARFEPVVLDVNRSVQRDDALVAALVGARALVIAGGDGTVHHAAPLAAEARVPVIHFPMGTENLFAREFRFTRNPAGIIAALKRNETGLFDIGDCNDRPFMLMGSIGFDACVVERVAANRRGGITRATYMRHGLAEFIHPRFVPVAVNVDGHEIVPSRAGMVVIANSRQYAARLDPARAASMTDGLLDIVFLPIGSRIGIIRRGLQVLTGTHTNDPLVVHARGRNVTVTPEARAPLQLDGEHAGFLAPGEPLRFSVRAGALAVLRS